MDAAIHSGDDDSRHSPELQPAELLIKRVEHTLLGIRHGGKRDLLALPIRPQLVSRIRPDGDDLGAAFNEFGIVLAQLRQAPAADWSPEPAQEFENDVSLFRHLSERSSLAAEINKFEIGDRTCFNGFRHCFLASAG
jgi:hypothetical protein